MVASSPARHHVYWLVDGLPVDQFAPLQKALARRYQGDPVVSDACRVMRLPGFYHQKDPARPVMACLIAYGLHQPYTPGQIRETLLAGEASGMASRSPAQERTPAATAAELQHARRLAQTAARRTREDPTLSRHAEVVRLGHYLRRDGIPLTRGVGMAVLDELLTHLRPTAAGSGEPAPFPRGEAARALRAAYRTPSEPDRPRPVSPEVTAVGGGTEDWPDPGIISLAPAGLAFPLEALPQSAREAVRECQRYGQQPLPLIAGAALGAMALATQGHADVARDALLRGPCSLNLLMLGESGERKSAADRWFTGPLRAWQEEKARELAGKRRQDEARVQLNEERRRSVRSQLAQLEIKPPKGGEAERARLEARLEALEAEADIPRGAAAADPDL